PTLRHHPRPPPLPYTTLFRSVYRVTDPALWGTLDSAEGPQYHRREVTVRSEDGRDRAAWIYRYIGPLDRGVPIPSGDYRAHAPADRKSTRLNSSHQIISYAVF